MATGIKTYSNVTNKHVKEILDVIIGLKRGGLSKEGRGRLESKLISLSICLNTKLMKNCQDQQSRILIAFEKFVNEDKKRKLHPDLPQELTEEVFLFYFLNMTLITVSFLSS